MSKDMKQILVFSLIIFITIIQVKTSIDVGLNSKRLQCYSCEGIHCQRISKQNVTTTCTDALDMCVTVFNNFDVTSRGCYLNLPAESRRKCDERNNLECAKCFGQLCNNKGRDDFKCIECNDHKNCVKNTATAMTPVHCPIPTAPNSYCYVRQLKNKQVQRGCAVHLQQQKDCLKDESCSLCFSNDGLPCNSYEVSASATIQAIMSLILLPILVNLF